MVFPSDISKVQDDEVGDGTTSVVVLASELLKVRPGYVESVKGGDYIIDTGIAIKVSP